MRALTDAEGVQQDGDLVGTSGNSPLREVRGSPRGRAVQASSSCFSRPPLP